MTEYEKMCAGLPYQALDAELRQLRERSRLACAKFNQHPSLGNMRHIKRLFAACGSIILEPGFQCDYGCHIHMGEHVYANFHCVLLDAAPIHIGNHVLLGPDVHIYTVQHPKDAEERRKGICFAQPVHIDDDVWVGGGAKILPGVHLGKGAIIGTNSVVTRDIPAGATFHSA